MRKPCDWTPLHFACNRGDIGVVAVLLKNGADINSCTSVDGGWTPLMEACRAGRTNVVVLLLEHGADTTFLNSFDGMTARDYARSRGHSNVVTAIDAACAQRTDRRTNERAKNAKRRHP